MTAAQDLSHKTTLSWSTTTMYGITTCRKRITL